MTANQLMAAVKTVLAWTGLVLAILAVVKLCGVSIPFLRGDVLVIAAVAIACAVNR